MEKDCSLCLLCHIFDSHSQSGCFYYFSFWPRRYECLKASVTTNYSWTLDNALKTDSFEIHILISISVDGGRPVINQLWPNSSVPLKCQSMWNPLVCPAAHLNNIFFQLGSASFLFGIFAVVYTDIMSWLCS